MSPVFVVDLIHRGREPGSLTLFFQPGKKAEGVKMVRNQVAQRDADEERLLLRFAGRALTPQALQSLDQGLVVLAFEQGAALRPGVLLNAGRVPGFGSLAS